MLQHVSHEGVGLFDVFVTGTDCFRSLDIRPCCQFVSAMGQQRGNAFPGRFQMKLQSQDTLIVEKSLMGTGLADRQMNRVAWNVKGIPMPVEGGEPFG